ncbi:MAG: hypothetical protein ABWY58_14115 [Aeromicrobium sp.]
MRKLARRIIGPALAVGAVCSLVTGASADDHPGRPEAGIPRLDCPVEDYYPEQPCAPGDDTIVNFGSWFGTSQVGLTGSKVAKQWTKVPLTMLATNALFYYKSHPGQGEVPPGEKINTEFGYLVRAFLVSPKGSKDDYGDSAPIQVRTVAFGSIPVEVTLQVSQERDAAGLPKPLVYRPHDYSMQPPADRPDLYSQVVVDAATIESQLNVRVKKVVVDGVDVGLGDSCQTGPGAKLAVASKELRVDEYNEPPPDGSSNGWTEYLFDPKEYLYGIYGGTLTGTIDIPRFTGCATRSGDDVSPLLTSALSEKGNPVSLRIGALGCNVYDENGSNVPIPPGTNRPDDPKANCLPQTLLNPRIVTVPEEFDTPDYAPGEAPND